MTGQDTAPKGLGAEIDVNALPPVQQMILEVLGARWRLGERSWTFSARLGPALATLNGLGLIVHKSGVMPKTYLAWLTEAGRAAILMEGYKLPALAAYEDLLASIWLYIPWQWVTQQLTTGQKELLADAIDASHARSDRADPAWDGPSRPVDRWWRNDLERSGARR